MDKAAFDTALAALRRRREAGSGASLRDAFAADRKRFSRFSAGFDDLLDHAARLLKVRGR